MAEEIHDTDTIPELQSPFEQIREVDADGKEWWNSRKLARVMGYGKYWSFERVIAKAQAWTSQKGYHLGEHFVPVSEMAELGSGVVREVTSIRLSRTACTAVAMNADTKKELVKAARQYFSSTMTPDVAVRSQESSIFMYKGGRGKVQVQVVFDTNTFWLSQQRMAELFGVTVSAIQDILTQIGQSGEIDLSKATRKIRIPSGKGEGEVLMYNLDVVIAVGYRVSSSEATQFRSWTTGLLKEYLTKGFVLDDERLKGKNVFGADYFDDLLDRIREIRISERRYYQKLTDIFIECSLDYDKDAEETRSFFNMVRNIMHYAVTRQTAAEIIHDRADADRPHMGLTSWKNAPDGRVVKSDVILARNYLTEKEVDALNRLSTAFIDAAELRALDHVLMTMADWSNLLQRYLELYDRPMLPDEGRVTEEQAVEKAMTEYDKFRVIQDREILSDFDRQIGLLCGNKM